MPFGRRLTTTQKLLRRNPPNSHIWPKRLGNHYAAVRLLIVLDDRNPGPSDRETAAVQCMHELAFSLAFGTETDVGAPRLESFKIRARRDLAKQCLAWKPYFNIVRLGGRKTYVRSTQRHHPVM